MNASAGRAVAAPSAAGAAGVAELSSSLANEIELAVRERRIATVRARVPRYLELDRSHARLVQACEWLRRLNLYDDCIRLLSEGRPLPTAQTTAEPAGERRLWLLHVLAQAGASRFALNGLHGLELTTARDFHYAGMIYLDHFEFARAHECYVRRASLLTKADALTYAARVAEICHADALAGLGRLSEALAQAERVFAQSPETSLQSMALSAQGEYLARAERFAEASTVLEHAIRRLPAEDRTVDAGLLFKWLGYTKACLGESSEGRHWLAAAKEILARPGLRFEARLGVLMLERKLGWCSEEDWALAAAYPDLAPTLRDQLSAGERTHAPRTLGDPAAPLLIDLTTEEWRLNGTHHLGLGKELRLLAAVALAQPFGGLDIVRAKSLLWSEEYSRFLELDNRLHALMHRIRKITGISVRIEERVLRIEEAGFGRKLAVMYGAPRRPVLAREPREFSRADVESTYGVSEAQAKLILQDWRRRGWIAARSEGRQVRYRPETRG